MALKMSAPWDCLYEEIKAFFAEDEEVFVVYDRDEKDIRLYVNGGKKAAALELMLKPEYVFGETKVTITVVPDNDAVCTTSGVEMFSEAFEGNDAFVFARKISLFHSNPTYYVVFKPDVVQYYTDDLGDWNGFRSALYEDIAREIFKDIPGVFYCTDKKYDVETAWM